MTPDQYWATPEGRQAAEWQRRFASDTKQQQYAATNSRPTATRPGLADGGPSIRRDLTGDGVPDLQSLDRTYPASAAAGQPAARRLPEPLSPSAPARPAAPNPNSKESVYRTLHQELLRMYPDRSPAELSQMARQLADEFIAERNASLNDMVDGPPGPTTLEGSGLPANYQGEWRWDGNKIVPVDQDYLDGQRSAGQRQAAERDSRVARQENIASQRGNNRSRAGYPERRLQPVFGMAQETPPQSTGAPYGQTSRSEQHMTQMLKNSRGMALQAERDKHRETGVSGPLMREDLQDRIQRKNMAAQFKAYTSGQSKVPPPGMAQPIQAQGRDDPYGGPSKQEMYWQLVDGGMAPAQASDQVNRAFSYAPR